MFLHVFVLIFFSFLDGLDDDNDISLISGVFLFLFPLRLFVFSLLVFSTAGGISSVFLSKILEF